MSEGVITDEAMKEMADQLKEKYDEITDSNKRLMIQSVCLKKDLITLYSIFRLLDNLTGDLDMDPTMVTFIEIGRSIASTMLDIHIFNI